MTREVLLVVHTGRQHNLRTAEKVAAQLIAAGMKVRVLAEEAPELSPDSYSEVVAFGSRAAAGTELVLVLGGDGTLLRAAELARLSDVPVFGVNMGRVGFLTGAEADALEEAVSAVVEGDYHVEERMTIDITATLNGQVLAQTWALNEASVEKSLRERILDVVIEVDGQPVSAFGCDGVLCATPTGSTAYAFSAGGPVIWPEVRALLVIPSNAHALFARPLVVSQDSLVALEIDQGGHDAVLSCDGQRHFDLPAGARVEVVAGRSPVRLVRLQDTSFTNRLVRKFELPVQGWRGPVNR
ncbi:NAD kinase [Saccharopolyspora rectivirgula]|uniref:NAD kinase n=1 Tax=Saccharopolyspora rectivirgula TaxID=28042 RepID=A0A073B371_9PSEU|nr:NAD kinase [Saccharopolyspora rectivirgula]KEI45682.1 inorganic polyphosphate kinase [Saccharopolyspora rectivirgula]